MACVPASWGSSGPACSAGATAVREPTEEDRWRVLADPEGNEFCAFVPEPAPERDAD